MTTPIFGGEIALMFGIYEKKMGKCFRTLVSLTQRECDILIIADFSSLVSHCCEPESQGRLD